MMSVRPASRRLPLYSSARATAPARCTSPSSRRKEKKTFRRHDPADVAGRLGYELEPGERVTYRRRVGTARTTPHGVSTRSRVVGAGARWTCRRGRDARGRARSNRSAGATKTFFRAPDGRPTTFRRRLPRRIPRLLGGGSRDRRGHVVSSAARADAPAARGS